MASIFKTFLSNDIVSTRTLLHEVIPITGSIVSGTYNDSNIKNYTHGQFQSVYDFPIASSSANHLFDITFGYSPNSSLSSSTSIQNSKKINAYNQLSQVLMGHDVTGSILEFDEDGNILAGGTKIREAVFLTFSRLLYKDEIKKGSFSLVLGGQTDFDDAFSSLLTITDSGAQNDFRVNSPTGEYGILSASIAGAFSGSSADLNGFCGLLFYQAGIAVLTASVFLASSETNGKLAASAELNETGSTIIDFLTGSNISSSANAFRHRVQNISYNNTTELNSTFYFCRINNNDFNYSSNPTYLSGSKINVKNNTLDAPVTYLTTVGLYSSDNELLAVAKLSEPLKKDPTNEISIRARLDF